MLAGVRPGDIGNRAGLAKVRRPCLTKEVEQAAFLYMLAAKIIAVEMRALPPGRCLHDFLDAGNVLARTSVYTNGVTHIDKGGTLHHHA